MRSRFGRICAAVVLSLSSICTMLAEQPAVVLDRGGSTIVLEPYAPNIVRVTLSTIGNSAVSAPGYGFIAGASGQGWVQEKIDNADVYRSPRLMVSVATNEPGTRSATQTDISKYFHGANPSVHITISTATGKTLLDMTNWWMAVPNYKDDNARLLHDRRPSDAPFYRVGAIFRSPSGEHYYGLGQNQECFLDHRGHTVECWHNYLATGGPSICVPFVVTNIGTTRCNNLSTAELRRGPSPIRRS
jgi:alpha-D-xyloside xylohydrolase